VCCKLASPLYYFQTMNRCDAPLFEEDNCLVAHRTHKFPLAFDCRYLVDTGRYL
jgi:hypothetical protein